MKYRAISPKSSAAWFLFEFKKIVERPKHRRFLVTFAVWLRKQPATDADARQLNEFANTVGADWPFHINDLGDYIGVVNEHAAPNDKKVLLDTLGRMYTKWLKEEHLKDNGLWSNITFSGILLSLFGVIVSGFLIFGIFRPSFLNSMASAEHARGLITFLFSFSTIAIVILVAISIFWSKSNDFDKRFSYAKDIVTIVIGVLGTILGFYFGSLTERTEAPEQIELAPSQPAQNNSGEL